MTRTVIMLAWICAIFASVYLIINQHEGIGGLGFVLSLICMPNNDSNRSLK